MGNPRAAAKEMAEARRRRLTHRGRRHRARRALRGARSGRERVRRARYCGGASGGGDAAVGRRAAAVRAEHCEGREAPRLGRCAGPWAAKADAVLGSSNLAGGGGGCGARWGWARCGGGTTSVGKEQRVGKEKQKLEYFFFNFLCRGPLAHTLGKDPLCRGPG